MRGLLAILAVLVASCHSAPSAPPPLPAPPPPSAASLPPPVASVVRESPRLTDARWILARDPDPLEKARLAVAVGAAELLAGLDDGGETADTALAALPFADDAEIALGSLGHLARTDAGRRGQVLAAILEIAGKPPLQREPLDLEGARRCGEALLAIAADDALARSDRVIAVSAARALAEHGYVDRARIPADLDPVPAPSATGSAPARPLHRTPGRRKPR